MLRVKCKDPFYRILPTLHTLTGKAIDKVQVEILYLGFPHCRHGNLCLCKRMEPVKRGQFRVAGRLNPQRNPVDSAAPQGQQPPFIHAVWIALNGDLRLTRHIKALKNFSQQLVQSFLSKNAGCASSQVNRVHLILFGQRCRLPDMS